MTDEHEPGHEPEHPSRPDPGKPPEGLPDRIGLDDVARSAAHAFDLLPAGPDEAGPRGNGRLAQRLRTDPDTVERDLMKLVLTIVELLRQLMERTALNRVDQGDLSEDQEERIGMTLMILHERMTELCERYGLTMADLNLDLGPLGSLLPREHW
jgi:gas vesicle protein GvpK